MHKEEFAQKDCKKEFARRNAKKECVQKNAKKESLQSGARRLAPLPLLTECRIVLPAYKICCALLVVVLLALIRGVSVSYEIGVASEPVMALLSSVLCADTYTQEILSRRSEVWRLYPLPKRTRSVIRRMAIQTFFLLLLAAAGYGLFFLFQKPLLYSVVQPNAESESVQFGMYLAAAAVTIVFWGTLSNTLACLSGNLWFGISGCLLLWLFTNSAAGERYLGAWNVFSYTFRNVDDPGDFRWLMGKGVCIALCIVMYALLPGLLTGTRAAKPFIVRQKSLHTNRSAKKEKRRTS
ncbi:MAG: hypothetical protein NC409_02545 [Clostridium sp.]|nr:hypothetical protein [Clostridium sp.]